LVSRGIVKSAAKIEENIPAGYKASLVETGNANFSFERQKVSFIWNKLPIQKNFEISYKLTPISFSPDLPKINGSFMYLASGQLQTAKITEIDSKQTKKENGKDVDNEDILNFFNN
jgi:hypothetical protein